jgi:hypothetical protein
MLRLKLTPIPALCAAGGDVVMRSAPDEALLVKLGSPRERLGPGGRWALQSAAYALLDDDQPEKQQSQRDEEKVLYLCVWPRVTGAYWRLERRTASMLLLRLCRCGLMMTRDGTLPLQVLRSSFQK